MTEDWGLVQKDWEIWMEGFHIQGGGPVPASLLGRAAGSNFREACLNWFKAHPDKNFSPDTLSVWGCCLYANEAEARRAFG